MERVICAHCGCEFDRYDTTEVNGDYYCDDCRDEMLIQCDSCGEWIERDNANWFADNCYCDNCLDEETFVCDRCGERHWNDDINTVYTNEDATEYEYWCNRCRDYAYICDNCGRYFAEDCLTEDDEEDGYYYCQRCYKPSIIGGYHSHHGREVYFNGKGKTDLSTFAKYGGIGIELEVEPTTDCTCDNTEMAEKIIKRLGENRAVFERDGSLKDGGFEIITSPHTIKAFKKLDTKGMLEDLASKGYRSHNGGNCGLHIHFSKSLLGDKWYSSNLTKLFYFYHKHYDTLVKISRRSEDKAHRWAAKASGIENIINNDNLPLKKKFIEIRNAIVNRVWVFDRYQCINLRNNNTIEFRLGRGTLKADTFDKWIDLHIALMRNVHKISIAELDNLDLWLKDVDEDIKAEFTR